MINVALFPIPDSVTFPWVPQTLHVFEPRYRKMVRHCIDEQMLMGVCHTEKVLHSNTRPQTPAETLSNNQSTYKPCTVFSAGPVQLLEELDDGRMLIRVDCNVRLNLREERQTLPFSIWACDELLDQPCDTQALLAAEQCKAKILHRLVTISHAHEQMQDALNSDYWQSMPALQFSFAVTGMLGMDAELAQYLLEMTSTQERLDTVLKMINSIR